MTYVKYIVTISTLCTALTVIINTIRSTSKYSKTKIDKYIKDSVEPIFEDLKKELSKIRKDISDLSDAKDEDKMQSLRYDCLCFASDIRNGVVKTRQQYEEIFRMETRYNDLIKKHKITNGYMHEEMLYVHEQYRKLK